MKKNLDCRLPNNCSIANIAVLRQTLAGFLNQKSKQPVTLYADEIQKIDTAGIQLLYAFLMALQAKGMQWTWVEPSKKLTSAAKLLGVAALLNLS